MDINAITEKIYEGNDVEQQRDIDQVYMEMATYLKQSDLNAYEEFKDKAEAVLYKLDDHKAEKIVSDMRPAGQHWTIREVEDYLYDMGIEDHILHYYLAMNMAYNDFRNTARKHDVDNVEFYYDIASDFINDPDAKANKVAKYFLD